MLFSKLNYLYSFIRSKKMDKKIVVFESDDWGGERIPNNLVRKQLQQNGIDISTNPYSVFDTLERIEDLELLDELLSSIEELYGKKVKITTNFILANPDYSKIRENKFLKYEYETFDSTYYRRDGNDKVWGKIQELVNEQKLVPQFHGREHINVQFWLNELKSKNQSYLKAFDLGCYGIDVRNLSNSRNNLMAAFEYQNEFQKEFIFQSIIDGLELFEKAFKIRSETLVAPRHVWNNDIEFFVKGLGIKHIQTSLNQLYPIENTYKNMYHHTGQINTNTGMSYLVRNAYFEPSYSSEIDWIKKTFDKIKLGFLLKVPVIISAHRLNFVGGLNPNKRDQNLILFKKLLEKIIIGFPDVEFYSSNELAHLISKKHVRY